MKRKITSSLLTRWVGGASLAFLALTVLAMLLPVVDQANATTNAEAYVGVRAATMIGLYLESDSVNMDVTPVSGGVFSAKTMKFGVETNSEAGYRVMMSTLGDTNSLVSTNPSKNEEKYMIPSITTETVGTNFDGNVWGFALGATGETDVYRAIPDGNAAEIVNTEVSTAGQRDEYNLTFGTHIDTSLPAGDYGNSVLISVVANAEEITNLDQVTYMQDMTPEICANTPEGVQRQLYDVRDGNKYWVAKMKDGRCWMVQNLALNLEGGKTYTAADTDLANTATKAWTVPASRGTETGIPAPFDGEVGDIRSWNLGEYIIGNPSTLIGQCPEVFPGEDLTEKCSLYVNVEGWNATGYAAQSATAQTYNLNSRSYDPRYLLGNYYQFGAATAGTGLNLEGDSDSATDASKLVNASGSICPKGWKLPSSGQNNTTGVPFVGISGSFYGLYSQYGYDSMDYTLWNGRGLLSLSRQKLSVDSLVWWPLYFVRAGVVYADGFLSNLGDDAQLWTSTVASSNMPNELILSMDSKDDISLFPAYYAGGLGYGVPVRCVSTE